MSAPTVLVIEDEEDIRELIHFNLFKEQYQVLLAKDGEEGLALAKKKIPELILLDLMISKIDGLEVCKLLKSNSETKNIPIIMVTAKKEDGDVVKGFEVGADDYLAKPFAPKVLLARVRALLKRSFVAHSGVLKIHGMTIDGAKRKFYIGENEISLTYSEFQILSLLSARPGWVYARSQIVDTLRGENHAITDRSVDVQIVGLRKKMGDFGELIETVRGVGYRIKGED